jgi:hypothetical protein
MARLSRILTAGAKKRCERSPVRPRRTLRGTERFVFACPTHKAVDVKDRGADDAPEDADGEAQREAKERAPNWRGV